VLNKATVFSLYNLFDEISGKLQQPDPLLLVLYQFSKFRLQIKPLKLGQNRTFAIANCELRIGLTSSPLMLRHPDAGEGTHAPTIRDHSIQSIDSPFS
jgi:hypothetical protein